MTPHVLVTGAGGFVGSHMVEGFLAMGHAVTALDRGFDAPTRTRLSRATLVETALTRNALACLPKFDLLIHGAAITTPPADLGLSESEHIRANVDLLLDCLDFAAASGARDFVFLSSSGVFGLDDGDAIHLETTPARGDIPYALAKRAGEKATEAAGLGLLRAVSVRLGPLYGPHEAPRQTRMIVSQVRRWLDTAVAGAPIMVPMPDERRDWTFAPDLPFALEALLRHEPPITGIVHLTSADIIANIDLAAAIANLVGGVAPSIQPSGARPRLPMASSRLDMPSLYPWTSLAAGLAQTLAAEAPR
ncbi:NAD-dependent epimerase/dehydratase family protein [uncultured Devosia sp.]|uniref:NAD-dependent epimerase/dehydratase family protein n=1 Tax=uncultured Devosia sp. TaxID=211434 RepID=UPI0035C97E43